MRKRSDAERRGTAGLLSVTLTDRMVNIRQVHPADPRAREILMAYIAEVVGRYHGRRLSEKELAAAVAEFPNDDLDPARGVLLVAFRCGAPVGCVGLRVLADGVGEVTRLYVAPLHRRHGLANQLMDELERRSRSRGVSTLRLDTRHDLSEARALYAGRGFQEIKPFNEEPYAERWFQKSLT